ncbi:hypothetical protein [Streptomyces sp. SP18BB07]|uniref:hypothetical protein n=1 Tax=Streptomyces sp. SP18BB07 TaxID=3002522 RepID=UPI002E7A0471|nr:hypothetical protein [Streptomyces sp. SP18BB07]MEE1762164.1 hypothetical protein [Streptomyces sp. SP18BB07]
MMDSLPFLRERDVTVLGNGGVQDMQPSGWDPDLAWPVHTVGLVALGLRLIDNMELTQLTQLTELATGSLRSRARWSSTRTATTPSN